MTSNTAELVEQQPEAGEPRPWSFPAFERRGRVIASHLPGKPLAVVSLVLRAGAMAEPADREGVALLLARALSEGTSTRDAYDFAVAGERLGATWRADTDWDSMRCGFEVSADRLAEATELLAEAVREPALDDATIARVRDERLDEVRIDFSQPGPRASAAFAEAVFTADSRYSRPDGGNAATIAALSADDVRNFHRSWLGPEAATLIVVGDLSATDVDALGETVFGDWKVDADALPPATVRRNDQGPRIVLVDRPGSVQSMLYVGHDAPGRRTPDYVPMTTMSLAFGGMFNSRLNYKLREEKGYTYGAFGGFDLRRDGGVFVARAAVQTDVTAPALTDLLAEYHAIHDEGITAEELERARSYRAGIFPINFAGPGAVASGLGELVVHEHPDDHFDRLRAEIQRTTLDEVNAAAAERLRPDDVVVVVVGDAAAVGDDLSAIGLPVEVIADED
jgi:predicted Zn-dependent peptidase